MITITLILPDNPDREIWYVGKLTLGLFRDLVMARGPLGARYRLEVSVNVPNVGNSLTVWERAAIGDAIVNIYRGLMLLGDLDPNTLQHIVEQSRMDYPPRELDKWLTGILGLDGEIRRIANVG